MTTSYKFKYFNLQGRGEVSRYLLEMSGKSYEDARFEFADWPTIKPTMPFGKAPVLEVGTTTIIDSQSIARYLAREHGFMGESSLDQAQVDMVMTTVTGAMDSAIGIKFMDDKDESKAQKKEEFLAKELPHLVTFLETLLGERDWLVGNKVSVADVVTYQAFKGFFTQMKGEDAAQSSPKISALMERFEAIPAIEKYISSRPATPF